MDNLHEKPCEETAAALANLTAAVLRDGCSSFTHPSPRYWRTVILSSTLLTSRVGFCCRLLPSKHCTAASWLHKGAPLAGFPAGQRSSRPSRYLLCSNQTYIGLFCKSMYCLAVVSVEANIAM